VSPRSVKHRRRIAAALLGVASSLSAIPRAHAQLSECPHSPTRTGIYVAPFDGDVDLRQGVAAVLNLQIWRLLERENPRAPGLDFGCGFVEPGSPRAPMYAQLLLSGSVGRLGDDAVVVTSLKTVAKNDQRRERPEIWTVAYGEKSVSLTPLKDFYSFTLFPIRREALARFPAIREIRLCQNSKLPPDGVCAGPVIGVSDLSHVDQKGDFSEVQLKDGRKGWIFLPTIGEGSEVVDFVSAVVRMKRGDFFGADELLERVKASKAETAMRGEALFVQAVARELAGRSSSDIIASATALNPFSKWIVKVRVMSALRAASLAKEEGEKKLLAERAKSLLDDNQNIFGPADKWYKDARALSEAL
jgi:hypothetical protein